MRFFGSKCPVLKKVLVTFLWLFGAFRSDSEPPQCFGARGIVTPLPPSLRPCYPLQIYSDESQWPCIFPSLNPSLHRWTVTGIQNLTQASLGDAEKHLTVSINFYVSASVRWNFWWHFSQIIFNLYWYLKYNPMSHDEWNAFTICLLSISYDFF